MLSFGNLLANVRPVAEEGYYTSDARVLLLLPLHHVLPLVGALVAPLFAGSTVVIADSLAGEELVATLRRHAVTTIVGVPRFYELLGRAFRDRIEASRIARALFAAPGGLVRAASPGSSSLGSLHRRLGGQLRHLISGGAALEPETASVFDTLGFRVCQGYGMTECSPMITFPRLRGAQVKLGSCGQVLRGCELRILDGEILARGPNVMQGYYGRAAETAEVLRDGWIHTGDLGRLDADGFLYVTGRLKEILVLPSGKNVNPVTIEAELQAASPAVREAGVFLDGETLHALVVADHDGQQRLRRQVPRSLQLARRAIQARGARNARSARAAAHPPRKAQAPLAAGHRRCQRARRARPRPGRPTRSTRARDDRCLPRTPLPAARARRQPARGRPGPRTRSGASSSRPSSRARSVSRPRRRASPRWGRSPSSRGSSAGAGSLDGSGPSWSEILSPVRPPELPRSSGWHRAIVYASRGLVRACFRTRASGQERLPPWPCILASNHQSFLDGLFLTAHLPTASVLRSAFYAKAKHVDRGWLRFLAKRCNVVVASADEGFRRSLQKLAAALRRGDSVLIFPEGTRSPDGALGPFRESYAILARELDVPVVPVAIDGAQRALPKRPPPAAAARAGFDQLPDPLRPTASETLEEFNRRVRESIAAELARGRG